MRTTRVNKEIKTNDEARLIWNHWVAAQLELAESGFMALRHHHIATIAELERLKASTPLLLTKEVQQAATERVLEYLKALHRSGGVHAKSLEQQAKDVVLLAFQIQPDFAVPTEEKKQCGTA